MLEVCFLALIVTAVIGSAWVLIGEWLSGEYER